MGAEMNSAVQTKAAATATAAATAATAAANAASDEENTEALLEAARYDDIDDIITLESNGVSLDSKDSLDRTVFDLVTALLSPSFSLPPSCLSCTHKIELCIAHRECASALKLVTCILQWATYSKNPTCPQCKHPFEFLNVHRSLDGSIHDYMFEESVCLLLRASWFKPLTVEEQANAYSEIEDYDFFAEEYLEDDLDEVYYRFFIEYSNW
ncbi:hypothetical protein L484_001487 [Morus notabilis]|uniref:RING-type domain-containing protein n=1 Tax=Morus notabilis TaxID=981085 RepID=W9R603_9ROSA|nr:hypothetical protein L484_001487 [Morus notabilis]